MWEWGDGEFDEVEGVSEVPGHIYKTSGLYQVVVTTLWSDGRNNLTREVSEQLKKHFKQTVLNTIIPRNVRLAEAPSYGQSIVDYDIKSIGAEAFLSLAGEFIRKFENGKKNISK